MMKALEAAGLIQREWEPWGDGRQKMVWLTVAGRAWIKRTLDALKLGKPGPVQRTTHSIFVEKWWSHVDCFSDLSRFEALLSRLRRVLMDRATLRYPWAGDSTG